MKEILTTHPPSHPPHRSQPELCQQAAEVIISPLRTASLPMHAAWFQGDKQGK
jgi:hypothetical protein